MGPIILVQGRIILQTRMIAVFDPQNLFFNAIFFKIILASSCLESCYRVGIILASSWTVAGRATPTSSSCHFSLIILPSRKRGPEIVIILASSWVVVATAALHSILPASSYMSAQSSRAIQGHPGVIQESSWAILGHPALKIQAQSSWCHPGPRATSPLVITSSWHHPG